VTECFPEACRRCGGELEQGSEAPQRHQVWELPPIEAVGGRCPDVRRLRGLRHSLA
jgi:hypothetical protein